MAALARSRAVPAALATSLLIVALGAAPARALDPPPAASLAGLGADVAEALRQARRVAGIIGTVSEVAEADTACKDFLAGATACHVPADDACGTALVALFAKMRELRTTLDPRRAAAAEKRASDFFDVASRVALARGALARGACTAIAPEGAVATQMLLGATGARSSCGRWSRCAADGATR